VILLTTYSFGYLLPLGSFQL